MNVIDWANPVELRGFRIFWLSNHVPLECLLGRPSSGFSTAVWTSHLKVLSNHLIAWETYLPMGLNTLVVYTINLQLLPVVSGKKQMLWTSPLICKCFISTVCWEKKNCFIAMLHLWYVGYCNLLVNSENNKTFTHNQKPSLYFPQ